MKVFLAMLVLLFSTLVNANELNNVVVFGDSLSDNGNLYEYMRHRIPQSPPYYEGRFTNGPVWIEQLTNFYFPNQVKSHLYDYAFGGAAISDNAADDDILFTLNREIKTYLLSHDNKASEQSLFIIWIGGNNYLALPENEEEANAIVVNGIANGTEQLVKAGAKHILILTLPDLGRGPAARQLKAEEKLTRLSKHHNELLKVALQKLRVKYPNVQFLYFETEGTVNRLLESPEEYGFTNTIDTCYDVLVDDISKSSTLLMAAKSAKIDETCEGYLFFDPVHPTTLAHRLIAEDVRAMLDASHVKFKK
ncbi:lysophospholipase A [Legionella busanensis]|uniref:Lysophospholipase A n=1 Tax=Legionella busanensis TaxID=190655 RepID=A0A378JI02_9GAMM|nr:SGNH/GDSL hydrolase family protein [Legionella busanensis]STX50657.1 lysophospholipase A [Legionella busanensis]